MVAELDGETIAMAITLVDANQVLKKMKGRLIVETTTTAPLISVQKTG